MPRQTVRERADLTLMLSIVFLFGLTMGLVNTFLPIYMNFVGVSLAGIGVVYALGIFTDGFSRLFTGPFGDFYSKKLLILGALAIVPPYIYGITLAQTTSHFILLKIVYSFIVGVFWTALMGLYLDKIPMRHTGRQIAKRHVFSGLAAAIAGFSAGFLINLLGFIRLYQIALVISFLPIFLTLALSERSSKRHMPSFLEAKQEYKDILLTKGALLLISFGLVQASVHIVWNTYTPLYLEQIGMSLPLIGILLAGMSVGKILVHVPRGIIIDKFHAKWMIIPGFFIAWISGFIFLEVRSFVSLLASRFGVWLGADFIWQPSIARLSEMTPKQKHAGAIGLFYSIAFIGAGFATLLASYLVGMLGIRATMEYFLAALLIYGTLLLFFNKALRWKYGYHYKRHHLLHIKPLNEPTS